MLVVLSLSDIVRMVGVERYINILIGATWLGIVVYAVLSLLRYYGLLQLFVPSMEPSSGRLDGLWGQPNLTTTMLWIGVLVSAMRFDWRRDRIKLVSCVVLMGWVISSAASRMSWLDAAGLALLAGLMYLPSRRNSAEKGAAVSLLLSVGTVVILLFVVPKVNDPINHWLTQAGLVDRGESVALVDRDISQDAARLSEFFKFYDSLSEFSTSELVFGIGPGNYANFSAKHDSQTLPDELIQSTWLHSHNLFTMIFVELGGAGLILIVAFIFAIGYQILRKPIDRCSFFSAGSLGLIFIHSNLEFPLWYPWFLFYTFFLIAPLFPAHAVKSDISILKPAVGVVVGVMTVLLIINVGSRYRTIVDVADKPDPDINDYQALAAIANDSLMGPYAVLRRYYDFAPEKINLEWQLREVRRIKAWQPRDLVMLREYSILLLMGQVENACDVGRKTAYRYPKSAPIMLEHAAITFAQKPSEITVQAECIEKGLKPWDETISSMKENNTVSIENMINKAPLASER